MSEIFDVIVVGGGPSGASAAYRLAAGGRSVLVLEQAPMPRHKLCGGAVSEQALQYLDFAVPKELYEWECFGARVHYAGRSVGVRSDSRVAVLVSRARFDKFLLDRAQEKGAEVRFEQVRRMEIEGDRVLATTESRQYGGRLAIVANGAASALAQLVRPKDGPDAMGYCLEQVYGRAHRQDSEGPDHWGNIGSAPEKSSGARQDDGLVDVFFGVSGFGYGWIFPHGETRSIGVGGLGSLFPNPRDAMRQFWVARGLPEDALKPKGWPIPCGGISRRIVSERLILAGDAAGFVDAFNGEGIAHAIRSGQLAAQTASDALRAEDFSEAFLARAVRSSHTELRTHLRYSLRIARLMHNHPSLFIRLMATEPKLLRKYLLVAQNRLTYRGFFVWLLSRLPLLSLRLLASAG